MVPQVVPARRSNDERRGVWQVVAAKLPKVVPKVVAKIVPKVVPKAVPP